jgi:PAS domain S-box-containing protein
MKKPTRPVRRKKQPVTAISPATPAPLAQLETPQRERDLFRTILDNLPSIIFCKDKDGRYILTNRAHQRVLGATEKAILGKTAFDFHPPDLARQYLKEEKQIMRTGEPLPPKEEIALHHEQGKHRWHLTSRIPFQDESGRVIGVFGISHDITERKQAEETLRESEAMLKQSQHVARLGHYKLNAVSGDWTSSQTLDEIFGLDDAFKKNVAGWSTLIHPEDRETMLAYLQDHVLKGGSPFDKEYRIVRANDGSTRWVHGLGGLRFDASGGVTEMFGTIQDITERKQAEETLRRERTLLDRITTASPVGITVVDCRGQITFANPQAENILGLTGQTLTQRTYNSPVWHITDLAGRPVADEELPFRRVVATGQSVTDIQHAIEWPDGRRVLLSINGAPLLDKSGAVDSVVFTLEDITERKRAEEALRESEARLGSFMNFVPALILIKDHELRPIFANNNFRQVFPADEWMGKRPAELFPPDVASTMGAKDAEALEKGFTSYEEEWTDQQGIQRVFFTQKFRIDIPGKKPLLGAIISDITERKQAETKLNERMEELLSWENVTLGREGRILELKKEVNELLAEQGKPPRYGSLEEGLSSPPPDKNNPRQKP